jgi:hypothetical protein
MTHICVAGSQCLLPTYPHHPILTVQLSPLTATSSDSNVQEQTHHSTQCLLLTPSLNHSKNILNNDCQLPGPVTASFSGPVGPWHFLRQCYAQEVTQMAAKINRVQNITSKMYQHIRQIQKTDKS